MQPYREAGLSVANSLSACLNLALLVYALRRKLARLGLAGLVNTLLVLVPDAILAGGVAAAFASLWERQLGHATLMLQIGMVMVPGGLAVLVYWLLALWLRVPAAQEVTDLILRQFRKRTQG